MAIVARADYRRFLRRAVWLQVTKTRLGLRSSNNDLCPTANFKGSFSEIIHSYCPAPRWPCIQREFAFNADPTPSLVGRWARKGVKAGSLVCETRERRQMATLCSPLVPNISIRNCSGNIAKIMNCSFSQRKPYMRHRSSLKLREQPNR